MIRVVSRSGGRRSNLRGSDLIARLGGDEYCAILVGAAAADAATALARFGEALGQRNASTEEPYQLEVSLGFAEADLAGDTTLERLVANADLKMLEAKRTKKLSRGESGGRD